RAGEILRRVRGFVRHQEHQCACVSVSQLIVDAERLCRTVADHQGVKVELELAEDLPDVWVDAVQIEQVLVNLIRNGLQAMHAQSAEERRLTVRTCLNRKQEIEVAVSDSGEGIAPGDTESIFEPFFTTRADGLGMGLSISRSIVENHGGRLWAESSGGK